jgi:hypothetical protein
MKQHDSDIHDLDLALALRRLADSAAVPPADPAREAALLAAFDAAQAQPRSRGHEYWGMAGLAAAAALLVIMLPSSTGRHAPPNGSRVAPEPLPSSSRGVQFVPLPGEFVIVPGAAALPDMESGSLVRVELPVSMLPSLGMTPRGAHRETVKADVIVGQDGLTRAVRLVN